MEHQGHITSSWRECLCGQRQVEFEANVNWHAIGNEVKSSSAQLDEQTDQYCNFWTDSEPARVKNWTSGSFAMDARMRLDSLKSGCDSPQPWCSSDNSLYYYDSEKDFWDGGGLEEEQSALDVVEILDMEDSMENEESWLYEPPNTQSFEERESALRWCRHVLDNPSPEMEAARRGLMNKLDQRSRYYFYRHAAVSTHSPSVSLGFAWDTTSVNTSLSDSGSLDHVKATRPDDFMTNYRLQDITDVHIMAGIQEDSLRKEYISVPAAASLRRNPDMFCSYLNIEADHADDFSTRNKNSAPASICKPGLTAVGSSSCKLPMPAVKQGCQSPKLTKLHQQVTQFKLLRLAQNKASPGRTRSPLQTSLRSLQALRNSRSLETDDYQPASRDNHSPPVAPSSTTGSSCGAASPPAASLNSSNVKFLMSDYPDRITAMKRLQRSKSLSPSRIAHPSKRYLSVRGRVFASPERPTSAAWDRHASSIQRLKAGIQVEVQLNFTSGRLTTERSAVGRITATGSVQFTIIESEKPYK